MTIVNRKHFASMLEFAMQAADQQGKLFGVAIAATEEHMHVTGYSDIVLHSQFMPHNGNTMPAFTLSSDTARYLAAELRDSTSKDITMINDRNGLQLVDNGQCVKLPGNQGITVSVGKVLNGTPKARGEITRKKLSVYANFPGMDASNAEFLLMNVQDGVMTFNDSLHQTVILDDSTPDINLAVNRSSLLTVLEYQTDSKVSILFNVQGKIWSSSPLVLRGEDWSVYLTAAVTQ